LDQALNTALKLEAIHAVAAGCDKQIESHRNEKGRDKYATSSCNDSTDTLLSKLDKRLDQMQSEFKALHNYVMSNKQQQNTVSAQAQSVNPPAALASQQKAYDAQMNSPPVGARSEVGSQQPPSFSNNRTSSAPTQKRRGCFICQDMGHFARSCPINNGNNQPFVMGIPPAE